MKTENEPLAMRVLDWVIGNIFPWIALLFAAGVFTIFAIFIYAGIYAALKS